MNIKEINTKIAEHIVLTIGLMALAFLCLGLLLGSNLMAPVVVKTEYITLPPQVITKTVEVIKTKTVEVPYIVRETVIKEIEVGVMVEVPRELRPFLSKEELEDWLGDYKQSITIWGSANFTDIDCEDYAYTMMLKAVEDGFILDTELVNNKTHVKCKAPIFAENKIYFIDWEEKEITGFISMD